LLILFGPPVALLGNKFFGWLFSARHGHVISCRSFSPARVVIAVVVMLALGAFFYFLSWVFTQS
jgi:hypothetical protein